MQISRVQPQYFGNYAPGYTMFTWRGFATMNHGIAHFTRFHRLSAIRVAHCGIVSGEFEVVEALSRGVVASPLQEYFENPEILIFFRKPQGWTPELGAAIAHTARRQIGKPYDFRLVAGHAGANLWLLRRLMSRNRHRQFEQWVLSLADDIDRFMCSELAAFAMDEQPALRDRGCLSEPNSFINPQRLFEDPDVYEPWKDAV